MAKKDEAFKLFDEGKTAISPEVKDLKLKGTTRYNYYLEWQKKGGVVSTSSASSGEAKGRGKAISELAMVASPSEEANEEDADEEAEDESEAAKQEGEKTLPPTDGKKRLQVMVAGQGLTFAITVSTKTLALYQIAASMQEEELTLGDFIDACVEDTYRGRGLDLGLVKIGGDHG